eukprot:COSAG02_NODE_11021_length_1810_cov_4.135009_1_plen_534_part_01
MGAAESQFRGGASHSEACVVAMAAVDAEEGDGVASIVDGPPTVSSLCQNIADREAAMAAAANDRNFREAGRIKGELQPLRRAMVEALYAKHDPEKLPDMDTLLAKYGEEKLYRIVREKYSGDAVFEDTAGATSLVEAEPESESPKLHQDEKELEYDSGQVPVEEGIPPAVDVAVFRAAISGPPLQLVDDVETAGGAVSLSESEPAGKTDSASVLDSFETELDKCTLEKSEDSSFEILALQVDAMATELNEVDVGSASPDLDAMMADLDSADSPDAQLHEHELDLDMMAAMIEQDKPQNESNTEVLLELLDEDAAHAAAAEEEAAEAQAWSVRMEAKMAEVTARQAELAAQQQRGKEAKVERARRPSMLQGLLGTSVDQDEPTNYASSLLALADDEEEEEDGGEIRVTFHEQGPLGLNLTPCSIGDGVMILAIQRDTQAASDARLQAGLVITAVNDKSVEGLSHADVTAMIASSPERPLELTFTSSGADASESAPSNAAADVASCCSLSFSNVVFRLAKRGNSSESVGDGKPPAA